MHERLYSLTITLLSLCYYNGVKSPLLSLPRHMLLALPIFIVLARWAGSGKALRMRITALAAINLLLLSLYVRHGWVP
jgi:hypothetical protein